MAKTLRYRAGVNPSAMSSVDSVRGSSLAKPVSESFEPQVSEDSDPEAHMEFADQFEAMINTATPEQIKWALMRLEEKRKILDEEIPETEAPDEYNPTHASSNKDLDEIS